MVLVAIVCAGFVRVCFTLVLYGSLMFVGICNSDAVNIRILNPKKRIENAYTQSGRIAKLRLSECSANSFEHCRTRAVYLNSPERPEQSSFSSILLRQVVREIEWGSKKTPPSTNDWVVMKGKVNLSNRHAIHANLIGLFLSFAHIGERSEHKTIATLLRKKSPCDLPSGAEP